MERHRSSKRQREVRATLRLVLPASVWGYCPHLTHNSRVRLTTSLAPEGIVIKAGAKHNHVRCNCPSCNTHKQTWYLCSVSQRWVRWTDISGEETLNEVGINTPAGIPAREHTKGILGQLNLNKQDHTRLASKRSGTPNPTPPPPTKPTS